MTSQKTREYWISKARGWAERLSGPQEDEFNAVMDDLMAESAANDAAALDAANEDAEAILVALKLILDCVDYTSGSCGLTEMVGGALPAQIIRKARAALASHEARINEARKGGEK